MKYRHLCALINQKYADKLEKENGESLSKIGLLVQELWIFKVLLSPTQNFM